ncbi:bifunctional SulP family inorganic anion transporter/carbonic anhydrase [Qaidamihabitans albus]|uniref:bifunctional SulP family inorganic anion transporter/carbonic anhydrase n=1 Tax=Qaidamihabitans albus TaxID=2795733 RepID=UPI0018F22D5C|nr:bifunctional SulP family inorganic anion transporter/carbonic anhydrase [Qaidamihabitans albus]
MTGEVGPDRAGRPRTRPRLALASVLRHDLPASLVVFLVAVPLSLGIALASGAPIVAGLVAAIVGGVVAGLLGGSVLQVSGPAAGLTVVLAETIDRFGWAATCAITVVAGALQILLGLSRVARAALAISPAIVHGMLAGIGVTLVLGQLHIVLGGAPQSSAIDNIAALPGQVVGHHDTAALIGLLTIAILLGWGRLPAPMRRVPGPLAAITAVTVLASVTGMALDRVSLPGDLLAIEFAPELPDAGWFEVGLAIVTIALIASVESLLCAVAVDRMHTGPRSNLNRELVGQGVANMVSGAAGGLPVTGVIVRSSTNVAAGARSRASAVLHGAWVLLFTVVLAGLIESIPLAALAGLLVYVGAKLVDVQHIRQVLKHGDLPLYLVTLAGVVAIDLLTGVLIGIALSLALMLRRTMWSGIHAEGSGQRRRIIIHGALTFLSVPRLSTVLSSMPRGGTVTLELVVDYLDHAAFDCLSDWQHAHERAGGTVVVDEIGHPWFERGKSAEPTVRRGAAKPVLPRWLAPWSEWQAKDAGVPVPDQRTGPPGTGPMRRGTSEFQWRTAPLMQETMSRLATGQRPHTLFITCADARIVPNMITTSGPGDLFTVRNIGNFVPDAGDPARPDTSVSAPIEYAVHVLGVREIVVCGHSGCGAMHALLAGAPEGLPAVETWLGHGAPTLHRQATAGALTLGGREPDADADRLALHNVLQQLEHLRAHPVVAQARHRDALHLTGMYFDVGRAQVYLFDAESGTFLPAGEQRPADLV